MKERTNGIARFLENNALQLAVTVIGFLITIGNIYVTSKLAPLVSRVDKLEVQAADHENFVRKDVLKETLVPMRDDIAVMKTDIKTLLKGY